MMDERLIGCCRSVGRRKVHHGLRPRERDRGDILGNEEAAGAAVSGRVIRSG